MPPGIWERIKNEFYFHLAASTKENNPAAPESFCCLNINIGLSCQGNFFRSCHKFLHNSWSNFIFRIWTKHQLQNFKQTSASPLNLKFKILSRISTKIQLHNLYKTSATKYRPNSSFKFCLNFNFKILTKPCAQSLNKSLATGLAKFYQLRQEQGVIFTLRSH